MGTPDDDMISGIGDLIAAKRDRDEGREVIVALIRQRWPDFDPGDRGLVDLINEMRRATDPVWSRRPHVDLGRPLMATVADMSDRRGGS